MSICPYRRLRYITTYDNARLLITSIRCGCGAQALLDIDLRTKLACIAAEYGRTGSLHVILERVIKLDGSLSAAAAAAGSLPCLELAYSRGDQWGLSTISQAARYGAAHSTINRANTCYSRSY
jgi:hypothetical protein